MKVRGSDRLLRRAREIFECRAQRSLFFDMGALGETAWDILLALYVHQHDHRAAMPLEWLANQVSAPSSIAVRWVDYLMSQGLVSRRTNPSTSEADLIALTPDGCASLERYLAHSLDIARSS